MSFFRSLSFRLAALYAGVFTLSVALLLGLFYWINVQRPMAAIESAIAIEAEDLAQIYIVDGEPALLAALARRAGRAGETRLFAAWVPAEKRGQLFNLPVIPRALGPGWHRVDADIYRDGLEYDQLALLNGRRFDNGNRLFVGRDIEAIDEMSDGIATAAGWVIPLILLLALGGGLLMSRAIGRRIERIGAAARQVMAGDLSGRVPSTGGSDDFDQLAATLNAMLDRLQSAFETVRRLSDHAAHQLKTPLARLTAELEDARAAPAEDRDRRLDDCAEEAQRLTVIIDSLLRISRLSNTATPAMAPVALDRLVEDVVDYHAPAAEARGQVLAIGRTDAASINGDADLLAQALANLVDNAIKFAPDNGAITVSSTNEAGAVVVSVADNGPGVGADEAGRLGELFFRGRAGSGVDGNGLGLSLVAAVAKLHGATLRFEARNPGLVAKLSFGRNEAL